MNMPAKAAPVPNDGTVLSIFEQRSERGWVLVGSSTINDFLIANSGDDDAHEAVRVLLAGEERMVVLSDVASSFAVQIEESFNPDEYTVTWLASPWWKENVNPEGDWSHEENAPTEAVASQAVVECRILFPGEPAGDPTDCWIFCRHPDGKRMGTRVPA